MTSLHRGHSQIGSNILEQAVMMRRELMQSYAAHKSEVFDRSPSMFPPECATYEKYVWAYSISRPPFRYSPPSPPALVGALTHLSRHPVRSRAFGNYTLIPLVDLLNHSPASRLAPTLKNDGSEALSAMSSYQPGETGSRPATPSPIRMIPALDTLILPTER